jgi:hypothetical protein
MIDTMNFSEDFERESQKDLVYLQEELKLIESAIMKMYADEQRKEAKISVIIPQENPEVKDDEHKVLPF